MSEYMCGIASGQELTLLDQEFVFPGKYVLAAPFSESRKRKRRKECVQLIFRTNAVLAVEIAHTFW